MCVCILKRCGLEHRTGILSRRKNTAHQLSSSKGKKNYTQRHAKAIEILTEISKWFQKEMYQVLGPCE